MAKLETVDASLPTPAKRGKKKRKSFKKRGEKRVVPHGVVHIQASFNNTIITVTDVEGSVLSWSSAGGIGFKGSRKGTPFAATQAAINAGQGARAFGVRSVDGFHGQIDQRCNAHSAQWLPPSEAAEGLRWLDM